MVSKKISQLDTNGVLSGTDVVPVSNKEGTSTFKLSMDELVDYMDDNANFNPTIVSDIQTEDFSITAETTDTIFLIDAKDNEITVTLNNHTRHINQQFIFKRLNPHRYGEIPIEDRNIIIQGSSGNPIDGKESFTLMAQYESLTIVASNNGWHII